MKTAPNSFSFSTSLHVFWDKTKWNFHVVFLYENCFIVLDLFFFLPDSHLQQVSRVPKNTEIGSDFRWYKYVKPLLCWCGGALEISFSFSRASLRTSFSYEKRLREPSHHIWISLVSKDCVYKTIHKEITLICVPKVMQSDEQRELNFHPQIWFPQTFQKV